MKSRAVLIRVLCALVLLTAVGGAVVGTDLWLRRQAAAAEIPVDSASEGGLTATTGKAGWTSMASHQMDGQGGYQMPPQMMPGAPQGDDMRLGIELTLHNPGSDVCRFDLASEFFLEGGLVGEASPPHSDTFGELPRLNSGSAVNGVLYFDTVVPGPQDPPLRLTWKRDGAEHRLVVRLSGDAPDHNNEHGSQ